ALADATSIGIVIRPNALAPATIGVLHHADPLCGLRDEWFVLLDAHGFESSEDEESSVKVVAAPASEPGAVGFLLFQDELDRALHTLVVARVAVERQHFEDASG